MILRGIYRDGVVFLNRNTGLRDGDTVEVTRERAKTNDRRVSNGKRARVTGGDSSVRGRANKAEHLPGFGIWKRRKDIGDTAAYVRKMRDGVFTRRSK